LEGKNCSFQGVLLRGSELGEAGGGQEAAKSLEIVVYAEFGLVGTGKEMRRLTGSWDGRR